MAARRGAVCFRDGQCIIIAAKRSERRDLFFLHVVSPTGEILSSSVTPATFGSLQQACNAWGPFENHEDFVTIFGALLLDNLYLLVGTKVEFAVQLPGDRLVWRVVSAKWITIPLPELAPLRMRKKDRSHVLQLLQMKFDVGWYYCDGANLCAPFPHPDAPADNDWFDCDWSHHLRLGAGDCAQCCSVLIRGAAFGETITAMRPDGTYTSLFVHLMGRQSCANPGPRYFGRGLDARNSPGNDHVYELVMWHYGSQPREILFTRHTFLRGTVPVRFRSEFRTGGVGEAVMKFGPAGEVLHGSDAYFRKMTKGLARILELDGNSLSPQVRCISLLRTDPSSTELHLSDFFYDAVQAFADNGGGTSVGIVQVDWLRIVKEEGLDTAVATLWHRSLPFLMRGGMSPFTAGAITGESTRGVCSLQQTQFLRVNCADSLDRTNLGCFFVCLQVVLDMLSYMKLRLACAAPPSPAASAAPSELLSQPKRAASTPESTAAASSFRPPFLQTLSQTSSEPMYPRALLMVLGEMFVSNGDCVSQMYTSSQALHTNTIRNLIQMKEAAPNLLISAQRRYENIFEDKKKLRVLEVLLGRRIAVHFPAMQCVYSVYRVPFKLWGTALVLEALPGDTTVHSIHSGLNEMWLTQVRPVLEAKLAEQGDVEMASAINGKELAFSVHLSAVAQTTAPPETESPAEGAENDHSEAEDDVDQRDDDEPFVEVEYTTTAVALFPLEFLIQVNPLHLFVEIGQVNVNGTVVSIVPYGYPVQPPKRGAAERAIAGVDRVGRVIGSAAGSVKSGFLKIVGTKKQ